MNKNTVFAYPFVIILSLLTNVGLVLGQDCPSDPAPELECRPELLSTQLAEVDLLKQNLRTRFQFQSSELLLSSNTRLEVDTYRQKLNALRVCQQSLGQVKTQCHLQLSDSEQIGQGLFLRQVRVELIERDGECAFYTGYSEKSVVNARGESLLQGVKNNWLIQNADVQCQSRGQVGSQTRRAMSFGGYDANIPGSKGFFQLIDWGHADDYDYKVSQNWAKQISMGAQGRFVFSSRAGSSSTQENLVVRFDNGAEFTIDGQSGIMQDTNFLERSAIRSGECQTRETYRSGSTPIRQRVRFQPDFELTSNFQNLSVRVLTN